MCIVIVNSTAVCIFIFNLSCVKGLSADMCGLLCCDIHFILLLTFRFDDHMSTDLPH